jgi:betaine-homocysteine S-methyltransferase
VGFNCARGPKTLLSLVQKLRAAVDGPIAAVPVPYHTTSKHPSFQFLKDENGLSAYTLGLDRFLCTRHETAEFAKQADDLGVAYIGLCCGAAPHHIRAAAEALGRVTPASKYSPDLSQHALLGSAAFVKNSEKQFLEQWA